MTVNALEVIAVGWIDLKVAAMLIAWVKAAPRKRGRVR